MIAWLVAAVNVLLLAATLLGAPAPTSVGPWELTMVAGTGLVAVVVLLRVALTRRLEAGPHGGPALGLAILAVLPPLVSVLVGAGRGVPFDATLRAAAPYLLFLPVALAGILSDHPGQLRRLTRAVAVIGLAQAIYLLVLYLAVPADLLDPRAVRLARTTLVDPRTTVPLILGGVILPVAEAVASRRRPAAVGWAAVAVVALLGLASTQTRAMLLAAVGALGLLSLLLAARRAAESGRRPRTGLVRGLAVFGGAVVLGVALMVAIPHTRSLAGAIVMRLQERDTNRVVDEWAPAVRTVLDDGVGGVLAGIGSGASFITAGGEERTYVHNLMIYSLLYSGVPGAAAQLLLYLLLVASLVRAGFAPGGVRLMGWAALVAALFVYAQFFAVHKLFSYNLLLMLALQALAVYRPRPAG